MALLDLQGMEDEDAQTGAPAGKSGASKCCGPSGLSLAICC
ncbi:MAG: SapB/AmfS family lanthipeptide [Actinobacteria bacterium]|nr:SapB/AmfS family lanthipeptide [Actinomycetota bacterium]